jgi:phasin family protein
MLFNNELFSTAIKTSLESQLALFKTLTDAAFTSVEEIIDLNIDTAKAGLAEATVSAKQLMQATDPQEWLSCACGRMNGNLENGLAFTRQMANIAFKAQGKFSDEMETRVSEATRKALTMYDSAARNAPAGSQSAIVLMKSAIDQANTRYGQFSKAARQVADLINGQMAAAQQLSQNAEKPVARAAGK